MSISKIETNDTIKKYQNQILMLYEVIAEQRVKINALETYIENLQFGNARLQEELLGEQ